MKTNWSVLSKQDRARVRSEYLQAWRDIEAGRDIDPYAIWPHNWTAYMSPIEVNVWSDIRAHGLNFRPQVPIGPYFADFADIQNKIVIEVDGRQWHQDSEADMIRDEYMRARGWTVHRFWGKESYASFEDVLDEADGFDNDQYYRKLLDFLEGGSVEALLMSLRDPGMKDRLYRKYDEALG